MWIFVAEALGALGLLLFIVWWTLGPTQRREQETLRRLAREAAEQRAASQAPAVTDAPANPRTADPPG